MRALSRGCWKCASAYSYPISHFSLTSAGFTVVLLHTADEFLFIWVCTEAAGAELYINDAGAVEGHAREISQLLG